MSTDPVSSAKTRDPVRDSLSPGTEVEVRDQLSMGWAHGFEVAGAEPRGYRLRRLSDGSVLPAVFDAGMVRPRVSMFDGRWRL